MDSLPDRAGSWQEKTLFYPDQPDRTFTVRYRDPLEAVKTLLGDPAYAQDIVYKPKKIFNHDNRIWNEMWTGKWWFQAQVSMYVSLELETTFTFLFSEQYRQVQL